MINYKQILVLVVMLCFPLSKQAQSDTVMQDMNAIIAFVSQLPPLETLVQQAIANSKTLESKAALVSIKENELALIEKDWVTLFAVKGNVGYGNSFVDVNQTNLVDGVISNVNTVLFNVGVSVDLSPSYWVERKHKLDIQRSYVDFARSMENETKQMIRSQVTSAYLQLEYNRDVYLQVSAGAESNRSTVQLAEKKFLEGEIDIAMYNDIKMKAVKLKLEINSYKRNLRQSYYNLIQLVGN